MERAYDTQCQKQWQQGYKDQPEQHLPYSYEPNKPSKLNFVSDYLRKTQSINTGNDQFHSFITAPAVYIRESDPNHTVYIFWKDDHNNGHSFVHYL